MLSKVITEQIIVVVIFFSWCGGDKRSCPTTVFNFFALKLDLELFVRLQENLL